MKKNNQMKPDNAAKRLWAFFIVLTMCITVQPVVPVKAQEAVQTAARTIYTEFKDGNSTHSGDGSYGNPYNLFEDAYAAAGNGDEISILGSGAFLNAEAAEPFIFDKSVTVNGNGNTFSNRKGGFILNTDVTFKNITLRFSNRLHDAIFANGHKLVLENVTCDSGFRYVDIFGGSLYENGKNMGNHPGSEAQILITGGGTNLGNIYAGSMNGTYDGKTQIVLAHVSGTQNGEIYASGAIEPYVNQDDWFSTQEPDPPAADGQYTVSGDVEISLTGSDTKQVYGVSENHAGKTFLTIDTDQSYTGIPGIGKVGNLTVKGGGTFAPAALDSCTVRLEGASAIDLSQMETPQVHSIVSADSVGNRLILGKEQKLNVTDTITGALTFETLNGRNGKSGIAEYGHTYLELGRAADTAVSFTPTDGQAGMTLERTSSGNGEIWKTSELSGNEPVAVKNMTIKNPVITTTVSEISKVGEYENKDPKPYLAEVAWLEQTDEYDRDLGVVPMEYEVTFNGKTLSSETVTNDEGSFICIPNFNLMFETGIEKNAITPMCYRTAESSTVKEGTYYITIRPFSADEQIEQNVILIVNKDPDTSGSTATSKETTTTINGLPTAVSMQDELNLTVQTVYTDSSLQGQNVPSAGFSVYINQTPYEVSGITLQNGVAAIKIPVSETNGFHMGENAITVSYAGAGAANENYRALPSQANETVTVNPIAVKMQYDTIHNCNNGDSRRKHSQTDAGNDDRSRSRLPAFTQLLSRTIGLGSIIFSRTAYHNADKQADDHRTGDPNPVLQLQKPQDKESSNDDKYRTEVCTERQRTKQIFHLRILFGTDGEDTYNRKDNPDSRDQHRSNNRFELHSRVRRMNKGGSTKRGSCQDRTAIRFVQVGSHAGHVTHVVTYVIGNSGRVARVVFGDSGLYLTYKVGPHIGSFRIDTTADTGEECLSGGPHTESKHGGSDYTEFMSRCQCVSRNHFVQQQIPERNVEQAETDYDKSHYRTAPKGNPQSGIQRTACRIGCTG